MRKKGYKVLVAIILMLLIIINLGIGFNYYNNSNKMSVSDNESYYTAITAIKNTTKHDVKYIAHRGMSAIAPENTIPAFVAAGNYGMWGAECDISETADGHFVICHNLTIDAMTDGEGKIADKTLAELKEITVDAGNNIEEYPDLKLPTLEDYINCCKQYDLVPVIEIKNIAASSVLKFVDILKSYDIEDTAVIILSDYLKLNLIRTVSDVDIQFILDKSLSADNYKLILDTVAKVDNVDIDIHYSTATSYIVDYAHELGLEVNVWTVDNPTRIEKLINMGIDYITTNLIIDGTKLKQTAAGNNILTLNSNVSVKQCISPDFSQKNDVSQVDDVLNTGTYYYDESLNILSVNSDGNGGLHYEFDCDIGDVISVEYEYYPMSIIPALKIGKHTLIPSVMYSSKPKWESVNLSIPIKSKNKCSVDITSLRGRYKLRNVTIKHISF